MATYHLTIRDLEHISWALGHSEDLIEAAVRIIYHGNPPDSYRIFIEKLHDFEKEMMHDARKQAGTATDEGQKTA